MKKKNIIIIISVIVLAVLSIFTLLILMSKNKKSVDENVLYEEKIGNVCVGLTAYEMKLVLEKMKEMNWR